MASGIAKVRKTPAGVVRLPLWKTESKRSDSPVTTLKTAWNNVRKNAKVKGRWHDNRHTLITTLPRAARRSDHHGHRRHVSKQMLKHYSHIRMEAKRRALSLLSRCGRHGGSGRQTGQAEGHHNSPHMGCKIGAHRQADDLARKTYP